MYCTIPFIKMIGIQLKMAKQTVAIAEKREKVW
jgi:hypothetical protein